MEILEAREEHLEPLTPLWKELMDYHARLDPSFRRAEHAEGKWWEFMLKNIESREAEVLVAVEGEEILGYCAIRIFHEPPVFAEMPRGEIVDMFVREGSRRRGIGTALYDRAVEWFRERGIARVELMAVVSNGIGYPFWRKKGFKDYLHRFYKYV